MRMRCAFGDLGQFDAIVLGMRAYELRSDVVASNSRLLDYAAGGGTLVVLDQRPPIWDALKPAPFPATIGPGPRITDENAAVTFTDPASPLLNFPNKIDAHDFDNWVQERGLYFWEKWDPQYHTVLSMHDPGEERSFGQPVVGPHRQGHLYLHGTFVLAAVAEWQCRRVPIVREFAQPVARKREVNRSTRRTEMILLKIAAEATAPHSQCPGR